MSTITDMRFGVKQVEAAAPVTDAGYMLLEKIATRQAVVAIIGLGYVGLPLAVAFGETGFSVVGVDVDERKVSSLNGGVSYIQDVSSDRIRALQAHASGNGNGNGTGNGHSNSPIKGLVQSHTVISPKENGHNGKDSGVKDSSGKAPLGTLSATTDPEVLQDVDAVVICVPTPVYETKDPDLSYIISAVDMIVPRLHPGMLIVLESTTYPGTTEEIVQPRLEAKGLKVGRDIFLAFSPERIDPSRTDFTVNTTPKVLGGTTPMCLEITRTLYSSAIQRVVPVANPKTAEMVKLLENTFRAVNIGLANEMAIMCDKLGIDIWEVIEAAKTKPYGFMAFYPGPGIGGHCIPVDPLYLTWKMRALNYTAHLIETAAEINSGMPEFATQKVVDALNDDYKSLRGSRVLVLGVAYKPNVSDMRESPALELIHLLREKGADVIYHDPYVPSMTLHGVTMNSVTLDSETLQAADCIVIATDHQSYNWTWVAEHGHLIVDTRNAMRNVPAGKSRVVKL